MHFDSFPALRHTPGEIRQQQQPQRAPLEDGRTDNAPKGPGDRKAVGISHNTLGARTATRHPQPGTTTPRPPHAHPRSSNPRQITIPRHLTSAWPGRTRGVTLQAALTEGKTSFVFRIFISSPAIRGPRQWWLGQTRASVLAIGAHTGQPSLLLGEPPPPPCHWRCWTLGAL